MKNKLKGFYGLLGLVGVAWLAGCCTYPGMMAIYEPRPRPPAPRVAHYAPPPAPHRPVMTFWAPSHHQQAHLPSHHHGGHGGGHHR